MRILLGTCVIAAGLLSAAALLAADKGDSNPIPIWAYGTDPAAAARSGGKKAPDHSLKSLPGTDRKFTEAQIQNIYDPADWFPADHPAMPDIVAHGKKPAVWACALCHFPNGRGKPENAGVSGLPVSYFVAQMHEFRDGQRRSADSRKKNTGLMISFAKAMSDQEIQAAAEYYGSMKWTPWIKVVETDTVPRTRTSAGMFLPIPGAGTEKLGERIIEVPVDPEGTEELRNPHSGFIAYVPFGSIQKGKKLVENGARGITRCAICHGQHLTGTGPVPGIAGRSPSYIARQLYDMQQGTRNGSWTQLMKPVVRELNAADLVNISAYLASVSPDGTLTAAALN